MTTVKFGTTASPDQIPVMARVLDAYCKQAGITNQVERENFDAPIMRFSKLVLPMKTSFWQL